MTKSPPRPTRPSRCSTRPPVEQRGLLEFVEAQRTFRADARGDPVVQAHHRRETSSRLRSRAPHRGGLARGLWDLRDCFRAHDHARREEPRRALPRRRERRSRSRLRRRPASGYLRRADPSRAGRGAQEGDILRTFVTECFEAASRAPGTLRAPRWLAFDEGRVTANLALSTPKAPAREFDPALHGAVATEGAFPDFRRRSRSACRHTDATASPAPLRVFAGSGGSLERFSAKPSETGHEQSRRRRNEESRRQTRRPVTKQDDMPSRRRLTDWLKPFASRTSAAPHRLSRSSLPRRKS